MTLLPILFFIGPGIIAASILLRLRVVQEKVTVLLTGIIVGVVAFSTIMYVVSTIVKITPSILWSAMAIILPLAALLAASARSAWRRLPLDKSVLLILAATSILSGLLAPRLLYQTDQGIATSISHAWGDLGWHVANITAFAAGQTVPPQNPILAGQELIYPFLINFFSGLLMIAGADVVASIVWPALLLVPIFLTLFFVFAKTVTRKNLAAAVALVLVVGSGATFGWTQLRTDLVSSNTSLPTHIAQAETRYSGSGGNAGDWQFTNLLLTGLLPQRSLLFGLPLAITILLLLFMGVRDDKQIYLPRFVTAGILAGMLPLAHAHSVLALFVMILLLAITHLAKIEAKNKKEAAWAWFSFAATACLIGAPEILYYFLGQNSDHAFFSFAPGWSINGNVFFFWLKNTGLLIPAGLAVLFLPAPRYLKTLTAAGFILFLAGNLWVFAPWAWDNYKIFMWWLLATAPAVGWLVATKMAGRGKLLLSLAAILLVLLHVQSALLDYWQVLYRQGHIYQEWNNDAIAIASNIAALTAPGDIVLTAPYHNNPAVLAGRYIYLGFTGHVWSHGQDYTIRERGAAEFYNGTSNSLPETDVQYVLVGPTERALYPNLVIQPLWKFVAQAGAHTLYSVRQ